MTTIKAIYGARGYSLTSDGHAGTSQTCTAISAIVQALAGWSLNHIGLNFLDKGHATIAFPKQDGAEAVMDMTVIGLQQIEKAAPDDVKVEVIRQE